MGPTVSNKNSYGILTLKTRLKSKIEGILSYCWYHYTEEKHIADIKNTLVIRSVQREVAVPQIHKYV